MQLFASSNEPDATLSFTAISAKAVEYLDYLIYEFSTLFQW